MPGKGKVGDAAKVIMALIAMFLTVVFIPSSLLPESIPYSKLLPLYPTDPTQQAITVSLPEFPYAVTISSAHALALAYNHTESQHTRPGVIISLSDSAVAPGSNVTFLLKLGPDIDSTKMGWLVLHVFLVDPEGMVRVTYPRDDRIDLARTSSCQFSQQWNPYDTEVLNAFIGGSLALTAKVDNNDLSVGTWRIFAFVTGAPRSDGTIGQVSTLGGGTASFNVAVPPQYLTLVPVAIGYVGSFLTIFQVETYLLIAVRGFKGTGRNWLRENLVLVVGIALIMVYLYLRYSLLSS